MGNVGTAFLNRPIFSLTSRISIRVTFPSLSSTKTYIKPVAVMKVYITISSRWNISDLQNPCRDPKYQNCSQLLQEFLNVLCYDSFSLRIEFCFLTIWLNKSQEQHLPIRLVS